MGMFKIKPFMTMFVVSALFLAVGYSSALAGVEDDIAEMKKDLSALKKDVAEIKSLLNSILKRARTPQKTTSSTTVGDNDPVLGSNSAPLTLVEFSDYQCPYCLRFFKQTYPTLKKEYIETGKLRYVYKNFPLNFHKQARKAHGAASCAGEQGKYWEMHDSIFSDQAKMQVEDLRERARGMGLDMAAFNTCLDSGKYAEKINKDIQDGIRAGVKGTPSFILGKTREDGRVQGPFIRGAQPTAIFKQKIDQLLNEVSKQKNSDK